MRYFQRQTLETTIQNQLLAKTTTNFGSLTENQRSEIVSKLLLSQKQLCAYCECKISLTNYHIEHFEEQHDAPTKVFDYENLVLSCEGEKNPVTKPEPNTDKIYRKDNISCGHRKTKTQHGAIEINYALLLNPTENVSALFSYFDGIIEPSNICSIDEDKQAKYTIIRLNLDAHRIENYRINEILLIQKELENLTETQQKTYIQSLLDETESTLNPYFSTIKDNFGFMLMP
jgi:uncharacterized protein (TIGR02646 family)